MRSCYGYLGMVSIKRHAVVHESEEGGFPKRIKRGMIAKTRVICGQQVDERYILYNPSTSLT